MACDERIRDLLPDYYLGQLPESEAEEVRRHLASEPECRAALEEIEQTLSMMPFAVPWRSRRQTSNAGPWRAPRAARSPGWRCPAPCIRLAMRPRQRVRLPVG